MLNLLSSSRKAQFFVLTTFIMVSILYFVSKWLEPSTIPDTSVVALRDEPFVFNNVVEKAKETVKVSKSCEDLMFNLEEFKDFVESVVQVKNKWIIYYQLQSPCALPGGVEIPTVVEFNLTLFSPRLKINSVFFETWVPS